jgi:hypothetical protein
MTAGWICFSPVSISAIGSSKISATGGFKDVTEESGLRFPTLFYRGAVFADLNGDGWLDLLVGSVSQGVFCFLNDGRGHFTNATAQAGTASPFTTETLALADIDGNGTLDLYACNYRSDDIRDVPRVPIMFVNRKPTVPPQLRDRITLDSGSMQEFGEPDILYLNDGAAHFRSVSFTNGAFFDERGNVLANTPLDWGLAAAVPRFERRWRARSLRLQRLLDARPHLDQRRARTLRRDGFSRAAQNSRKFDGRRFRRHQSRRASGHFRRGHAQPQFRTASPSGSRKNSRRAAHRRHRIARPGRREIFFCSIAAMALTPRSRASPDSKRRIGHGRRCSWMSISMATTTSS